MKHRIDPTVNCVFKAILGAEENKNLLLHFLNHIVKPSVPLLHVDLLNPYNEKEFDSDKLTVVDVKARDENGVVYQIEIQLAVHRFLPERILYTWSDLYQSQLGSGDTFNQLRPAISIWLLTKPLLKEVEAYHHHFQIYDALHQQRLTEHCSIHVLELSKWIPQSETSAPLESEDSWCNFFRNAQSWETLPETANTLEMRQAMSVLQQFSERERDYHRYQARQNFLREQATIKEDLRDALREKQEAVAREQVAFKREQEALQAKQEALQAKQEALQEKQEAIAREQRLMNLLKQAGIDPDQ